MKNSQIQREGGRNSNKLSENEADEFEQIALSNRKDFSTKYEKIRKYSNEEEDFNEQEEISKREVGPPKAAKQNKYQFDDEEEWDQISTQQNQN